MNVSVISVVNLILKLFGSRSILDLKLFNNVVVSNKLTVNSLKENTLRKKLHFLITLGIFNLKNKKLEI